MVNPNNPNSEPDGVPSSESGSDPSSSESGPISDELFDSLSELLGDSPTTDESASLPDIESWSEEPAELSSSSEEELREGLEEPTLIQMGPEAETSPTDELSSISDSLANRPESEVDPTDLSLIDEDGETQPVDAWTAEPAEPVSPSPVAPDLPAELAPGFGEPSDTSLPDIAAATPAEPADTLSDPWADPTPEEQTPVVPLGTDREDPTLIQASGVSTTDESAAESTSPESPPAENILPDPWADDIEPSTPVSAEAEELTSAPVSTPETVDWSEPDIPPTSDLAEELPTPEDQPLTVGEESSTPMDTPLPIGEDLPPMVDTPLPIDPSATPDSEETPVPTSSEFISADLGETPPSDEAAEPISPAEDAEPPTDIPTGIPPLGEVTDDSAPISPSVPDPVEDSSESVSDDTPEVTPTPVPEPLPAPEPVAVGSTPSSSSSSGTSAGDLGPLSNQLPLNRYQAVGLLVALSTLGAITYFGVTGNQQDPLPPAPATSSPSATTPSNPNQPANTLPSRNQPIGNAPAAPPGEAPNPGTIANTPGQTPTN